MTSPYPPLTKPLALIILDGLGYAPDGPHNAVSLARIPCLERLNHITPLTLLEASGSAVGLPEGQVGNSEVGHTSLGMGAKILQDLPRIDLAFAEQRVAALPVLKDFILKSCKGTKVCHLLGLTSTGGVHSHLRHLEELIPILEQAGLTLYLHAISDGRDTQPQGFDKDLDLLAAQVSKLTYSNNFWALLCHGS